MSTASAEAVKAVSTRTVCVPPILGCLEVAGQIAGSPLIWRPINQQQEHFIEKVLPGTADLPLFRDGEFFATASWKAEDIEQFLAQHGFPTPVDPFASNEFGVAAVMKVLALWKHPGTEVAVRRQGKSYPAFKLEDGLSFLTVDCHPDPIASILTETGDQVLITPVSKERDDFTLLSFARYITEHGKACDQRFDELVCPMVDYDSNVDIDWILGMYATAPVLDNNEVEISAAKQKTRFRMNEKGARAESAVHMTMRALSVRLTRQFVIDRPFMVIMKRPGAALPYFVGVFAEDVWKKPEAL